MKPNYKLTYAILAALSAPAGVSYAADTAGGLEEVIVTAQRRSESVQNVPITIQAITGEQLSQLSLSTFDDVIRYLPNVTFSSNGPGQGNIYMRGLSAGFAGNQSSASINPFPNVASYLDDQSMTFPARNLDIYMVDMERIEVLEGPQGTLFGGGAEAGAIRYITNKPKLNVTEGRAEVSYGVTAHGDPNTSVNGMLNLPLITDTLALRAVVYNDRRGGYIDNVPSKFTRMPTDLGPQAYFPYPANAPGADNYPLAGRAQNPVTYTGMRLSALYQVNDDWNVLLQQSYQNMEADGMSAQFPIGSNGQSLGSWEETSFSPTWDKDKYNSTALTVNGKLGPLKIVYAGAYLTRHIDNAMDYTNYARSIGGFYYTCTGGPVKNGGAIGPGTPATCYSPVSSWHDVVESTHQSHEFRVSTPDEWQVRGLLGVFWEDFQIKDDMNFLYKSLPSCTQAYLSSHNPATDPPCVTDVTPINAAIDPNIRNDSVAFGEDLRRGYKQTAFFGSVDYDIIPKVLTITGGTRYYRYVEDEVGSQYSTGGCINKLNGTCSGASPIGQPFDNNHNATYTGFRSRGNLTWHVTHDAMIYYTYSQGFRPGAFNRTTAGEVKIDSKGGVPTVGVDANPNLVKQYLKPFSYPPDSLTNNEIGFKTEFLDHHLLVNGSIYQMDWNNVQTLIYNPPVYGNTTFGVQGPNYRVKGFELQVVAKVTDGLTVQGAFSYNNAKETNDPCIKSVGVTPKTVGNPTPAGTCIAQVWDAIKNMNVPIQNPLGAPDAVPAFSPKIQFNLRARYDWNIDEYKAFVMAGANHIGAMDNEPSSFQSGQGVTIPSTTWLRYTQPAYTTYDASIGVAKGQWEVEAYGQNLSNSDASQFTSSAQFIKSEIPLRPRVLGLKVAMKF